MTAASGLLAPETAGALLTLTLLVFVAVDTALFFSPAAGLVHLLACLVAANGVSVVRDDLGPWHAAALSLVLVTVAGVVAVVAERASSASVDSLTGLHNRHALEVDLDRAVRIAERTGAPLAVALLDLDGFKAVNDTSGHAAGDELLRATAAAWRAALPEAAVLARIGGDEFAVVLPGISPGALAGLLAPLVRDQARTASAGVAAVGPAQSPTDVLGRADVALDRAETRGAPTLRPGPGRRRGDRVGRPGAGPGPGAARRRARGALPGRLRRRSRHLPAPARRRALVRWHHPERGPVSPAVFVPLAESHGLVSELGTFVLERACREVGSLPPSCGTACS